MLQDQIKLLERKSQKDESQIADLRQEIERLSFKGKKDEIAMAGLQQHVEALGRQCHETERARQAEEAGKKALERQVFTLKKDLSASSKIGDQITDDLISQKMDKVFYSFHNFAASVLRREPLGRFPCYERPRSPLIVRRHQQIWSGCHKFPEESCCT